MSNYAYPLRMHNFTLSTDDNVEQLHNQSAPQGPLLGPRGSFTYLGNLGEDMSSHA